ncbi:MAG: helix-turn-helix transcriptional regulator [Polyangiaceae bacterium]|nr:helix-turn-helix transcriptional regulator [Polyangiaceae bacterium]MCL4752282.1 hypothetical protein [Myxococcales bacterium]
MTEGADLVSVIEAAYAAAPCEQAWLEGIVSSAVAAMGVPVSAFVMDASDPSAFRAGAVAVRGVPEEQPAQMLSSTPSYPASVVRRLFASSPQVALLSEVLAGIESSEGSAIRGEVQGFGITDVVGIRGFGLDRRGVMLCPLLLAPRELPRTTRASLGRVARHLATGYRLRSQRGQQPEAVLSPTGRVEHAEPCARDRRSLRELVEATNRIGVARGRLRRESPDRAVELWRALVSGRWSIVETVERDGKRFLLARRNELGVAHARALTQSQAEVLALAAAGHSNGAIAYELGLSAARVSRALREGLARLELRSRAELLAHCGEEQTE